MMEKWKDIKGYEGLYKISNHGRILAISRRVRFGKNWRNTETKLLHPRRKGACSNPYLTIILYNENREKKTFHVHRLVALHFVEGWYEGSEVNHIDGNKQNNHYTNLEWCSRSENIMHSVHVLGQNRAKGKVVLQLTKDGKPVCFYRSVIEASNSTQVCRSSISDCALGKISHAGNYKWIYF